MARILLAAVAVLAVLGAARANLPDPWSGNGDPQFRGIDGRTFYFDGVPGQIFNIITEQDHQLNALFSAGPHKIDALGQKSNGTFMTSFGLQMFQSQVEMSVDEEGNVTVSVNGESLDAELTKNNGFRQEFDEPHGVTITVEKYRPNYGYAVTASSALFEIVLYSTPKQFDPVVQEIARAHLNFELAANLEALALTKCHGVLGQTAQRSDSTLIPGELSTLFLGEGTDADYVVSSIFAADSTYNLFGKPTLALAGSGEEPTLANRDAARMSAARRFLREGQATEYYPAVRFGGLI